MCSRQQLLGAFVYMFSLQRLQQQLVSADNEKANVLSQLAQKGDSSNKAMSEEAKRLNDKIQLITGRNSTFQTSKLQRKRLF